MRFPAHPPSPQSARIVLSIPRPVVRDYPLSRRDADSYADKYCLRKLLILGSEVTIAYDGKHLTFARVSSEPKPIRNQRGGRLQPRYARHGEARRA